MNNNSSALRTAIRLSVVHPDGTRDDIVVPAAQSILIGSGAHCDVRLAGLPDVAREHLLIEVRGTELWASARHLHPPPLLHNRPLFEAKLEENRNDEIAIPTGGMGMGSAIRIRASLVAASEGVVLAKKKRRLASTLAMSFALLALPGIAWGALTSGEDGAIAPPPKEHTKLFVEDGSASATCATVAKPGTPSHREEAEALGPRTRDTAVLLREQHPFDVADGLEAVKAFERAADCFRVAGNKAEEAKDAAEQAKQLREEIDYRYAAHRVRLEHALEVGDEETALTETRLLRRLLTGKGGAYVEWLGMLERRLSPSASKSDSTFSLF